MKASEIRDVTQTPRLAIIVCLLIGLVINPLTVTAQTRRGGTRQQSPTAAPKKIVQTTPTAPGGDASRRVRLVRSRKSREMSLAFANGKLPEPLRMPAGNIDAQAAALAKAVSAGDESSTAALYAAVLAAGFGVRDADGSVMQTNDPGQGLAFEAWEVAASSKLYGEGYGLTLGHLGEGFTRGVPEFRDLSVAAVLQEGIRKGASSDDPAIRFWARFIIELGRNSNPSYDILRQNDVAKIRLDAVQTVFLLKRILGETAALGGRTERVSSAIDFSPNTVSNGSRRGSSAAFAESSGGVTFVQARMSLVRPFEKTPAKTASPCSVGDVGGIILDYGAVISTTLFGTLGERLGGNLGKYAKAAGLANLILTVLKLIASYALLRADVTIDKQPLERTKTTEPGEKQILSAKLDMESDKWEIINCLRPALNAAGIDFNLPSSGPVADAGVEWKLIEGGDSRGWVGTVQDIPEILSGNATWGDGIVFFEPTPGTDRSPAKQRTGEDGISRMGIVGVPQVRDLSKEKLVKINKVAGVKVGIQLKPMKITDKAKLIATLGDLGGSVLAFLTGDFVGGVVGTGAETLYRSHWYSSEPFYFVVYDWEPCKGLWQGTMTTTTTVEVHTVEYGETPDVVIKFDSSYRFEAAVKFEGAKATATIGSEDSVSGDQKSGYGRITNQQKYSAQYSGEVNASASVSNGTYSVGFELPKFVGTYQSSGSCERPAPYKCQQPQSIAKPWEFNDGRYLSHMTGQVDPKNPNEINDTKTWGEPGQLQHKVTVNLKRCQ